MSDGLLVTGGLGFVGSHFVWAAHEAGLRVVVLDDRSGGGVAQLPDGVRVVTGDIGDAARVDRLVRGERLSAMVHFAGKIQVGESVRAPRLYFDHNVARGLSLLDAALDAGVSRVVFSSTAAVYGTPATVPITETSPREPVNPYGASKLAFEHVLSAYGDAYGLRWAAPRYFNAAGAHPRGHLAERHEPETHLLPLVIDAALGKRPALRVFGDDYDTPDGTCVRDYVHVCDLAAAHLAALESLTRESLGAFNLGTGRGASVREVIDAASRALGRPVPFEVAPRREGDPASLVADPSRAERLLSWRARSSELETLVVDAHRSRADLTRRMLEGPPVSRAPSVAQKLWPKLAVSLVLALGFVWLFKRGGVPLLPDEAARATLSPRGVVGYTFALAVCVFLRTWRWVYLLRPIDPGVKAWPTFGIGLVGFGLVMLSPFRMGELVRPYLVARRSNVTFVQATGTIAGERVVDGLLLSIALFLGLVFSTPISPLPDHLGKLAVPVAAVPTAARSALAVFGAAFVAMGLFYWARGFARRLTDATLGRVSRRLAAWLTHKIESVADGLSFLMSRDHGVPFFAHSVAYISSCVLLVWVGVWAVGLRVTLAQAAVLMGVSGLGILIPAGPGFFGAYQIANFCALAMFFREDVVLREGSAYVFLSYVTQLAMTLATMALGAALMRGSPELVDLDAR